MSKLLNTLTQDLEAIVRSALAAGSAAPTFAEELVWKYACGEVDLVTACRSAGWTERDLTAHSIFFGLRPDAEGAGHE